jgi:hypothetical protein
MTDFDIIGKLTKQEKVNPIIRNKIPNTFVIDIPSPIAHYYNRFGQENNPRTILLVTKNPISFEGILRATKRINEKYNTSIDGAKSEIKLGKRKFNGIRIKGIEKYSDIPQIQQYFLEHGFEFAKNVRMSRDTDSLIRVNKFFKIHKLAENIYQSPNNKDRYYIVIPHDLSWDEFRDVTFDIKNNVNVSGYDAAKGIFYNSNGIVDMVRIIKPDISLDEVREVQDKYIDRLS